MSARFKKFISKVSIFLLISGCLFPAIASAEQMLDVEDPFVVSKNSAYARAQAGYFQDALTSEEKTLQTAQDRFGPTHPSLAPILTDLATIDRYLAHYGDAESALRWALALREKNFGLNDPSVAESLDQLASLDFELGRFEEAQVLEKRALRISKDLPSKTVPFLCHLGKIQSYLHHDKEALDSLKNAWDLSGDSTPGNKMEILKALAEVNLSLGRFSDVESALLQIKGLVRQMGSKPALEADSFLELGDFYLSQGFLDKAKASYQSAFQILDPLVGVDTSYGVLPYVTRLAAAKQGLGDYVGAKDLWKRAVDSAQTIFGADNPQTGVFLMRLAEVEIHLRDMKSSADHLQKALSIFKSNYDLGHPLILSAQKLLEETKDHGSAGD